jgi:hypothetical protein
VIRDEPRTTCRVLIGPPHVRLCQLDSASSKLRPSHAGSPFPSANEAREAVCSPPSSAPRRLRSRLASQRRRALSSAAAASASSLRRPWLPLPPATKAPSSPIPLRCRSRLRSRSRATAAAAAASAVYGTSTTTNSKPTTRPSPPSRHRRPPNRAARFPRTARRATMPIPRRVRIGICLLLALIELLAMVIKQTITNSL